MSGGVDAITAEYAECFDLGYTYDCGKYALPGAPGTDTHAGCTGRQRHDRCGRQCPRIGMNYWVATSRAELETRLGIRQPDRGYCYDAAVIRAYKAKSHGAGSAVRLSTSTAHAPFGMPSTLPGRLVHEHSPYRQIRPARACGRRGGNAGHSRAVPGGRGTGATGRYFPAGPACPPYGYLVRGLTRAASVLQVLITTRTGRFDLHGAAAGRRSEALDYRRQRLYLGKRSSASPPVPRRVHVSCLL